MQNIAIIRQGTGRYLFSLPDNVTLKEGDRVKCSTRRGITDGVAFADSAWVDENVSQLLGKLTGAKFPLKSVVGKMEYHPFEKPEDKPANKYDGMSNMQLRIEMCTRGPCHVYYYGLRKHDCLFADSIDCDVTAANRAEAIKYLLEEDAEAAPKSEGKPTEDKQEPVKLYCVKDHNPGEFLTKGKVYEIGQAGAKITYDDGWTVHLTIALDNFRGEKIVPNYLVPLVARPAKVGEWVYITHTDYAPEAGARLGVGDVCRVASVTPSGAKHLEVSPGYELSYYDREYLVLDGYHPTPEAEPEPEPKYFSGKVVCVRAYGDFTVGKIYEFVNGKVKDDDGDTRPLRTEHRFESIESWNHMYASTSAEFIEFKGEAK